MHFNSLWCLQEVQLCSLRSAGEKWMNKREKHRENIKSKSKVWGRDLQVRLKINCVDKSLSCIFITSCRACSRPNLSGFCWTALTPCGHMRCNIRFRISVNVKLKRCFLYECICVLIHSFNLFMSHLESKIKLSFYWMLNSQCDGSYWTKTAPEPHASVTSLQFFLIIFFFY